MRWITARVPPARPITATAAATISENSGMAILNPPWGFAQGAGQWLDWLARRLASGRGAGSRLHWLKRER